MGDKWIASSCLPHPSWVYKSLQLFKNVFFLFWGVGMGWGVCDIWLKLMTWLLSLVPLVFFVCCLHMGFFFLIRSQVQNSDCDSKSRKHKTEECKFHMKKPVNSVLCANELMTLWQLQLRALPINLLCDSRCVQGETHMSPSIFNHYYLFQRPCSTLSC